MALRKKGTPAKIEIVIEAEDLEAWKKLINDSINNEPFKIVIGDKFRVKKDKKNKS
jgi:hypothetical protein